MGENSEFDIDSDAMSMRSGASRGSRASVRSSVQSSRLRSLEKNYLQRIEGGGGLKGNASGMPNKKGKKGGKFRGTSGSRERGSVDSRAEGSRKQAWDARSRASSGSKRK